MNILEGLKRLYIALSLLVVIATATAFWMDSRPMCLDYAAMSNDELLAGLQARSSSAAQTSGIDPKTVIWDKPSCITKAARLGRAVLGAAAVGGVLFILWLIIRWIVAGFFPGLKREK